MTEWLGGEIRVERDEEGILRALWNGKVINTFFDSPFIAPQSLRDSSPKGERVRPESLRLSRKLYRYAKGSLLE